MIADVSGYGVINGREATPDVEPKSGCPDGCCRESGRLSKAGKLFRIEFREGETPESRLAEWATAPRAGAVKVWVVGMFLGADSADEIICLESRCPAGQAGVLLA
jgi:hypothetical protein